METNEIDTINQNFEKLIGGYSLISKAYMVREIAELKERIEKASFEFGKQRDRITALETYINDELENLVKSKIEAAKTQLRSEMVK
jgi:hypothetical protein